MSQIDLPTLEMLELLGRGSTGSVYLARERTTGELVAVKHLRAGMDDEMAYARFRREALAMAALEHPGVVDVRGLVEHGRECFLVMEYVRGPSLRDVLRRVEPDMRRHIVVQIAAALDAVHRADLVHRDVKPANVLLTPDGACKLADFGVARYVGDSLHGVGRDLIRTRTGTVLGTPAYMAPEVAAGQREVDARADVYSLGVVAFELWVGRLPFEGTPYEVLAAQVQLPPPRPTTLAPRLPPELDAVLMQVLAKDPTRRYQSAGELADALVRITPIGSANVGGGHDRLAALAASEPRGPRAQSRTDTDALTESIHIEASSAFPALPRADVPVFRPPRISRRATLFVLVGLGSALVGAAVVLLAFR